MGRHQLDDLSVIPSYLFLSTFQTSKTQVRRFVLGEGNADSYVGLRFPSLDRGGFYGELGDVFLLFLVVLVVSGVLQFDFAFGQCIWMNFVLNTSLVGAMLIFRV